MQNIEKKRPIENFLVYLSNNFHKKKQYKNGSPIVKQRDVHIILGLHHIPKIYHYPILKELELLGLITIKDKQNIVLNNEQLSKIDAIEEIKASGKRQEDIAKELEISQSAVSRMLKKV